jgi:hypothetical protein
MQFYRLAIGARLEVFGQEVSEMRNERWRRDAERVCSVFQGEAEVTPIPEAPICVKAEATMRQGGEGGWQGGN